MTYSKVSAIRSRSRVRLYALTAMIAFVIVSRAEGQIEGFTEPFRSTELASEESGTITKLHIVAGQIVKVGDPIATLDDRVQRLKVELAEHLAKSNSSLEAARQTLEKRDVMLQRLQQMRDKGHAAESEIVRADLERTIAYSRFLAAEEETISREIDLRRSKFELERRTIVAPFDGVIESIHRHEGEFLSPVKPEIVHLIQIDLLLAVFPIPSSQVQSLQTGQEITVKFDDGSSFLGTVQLVAPTTDAQSDTVQIKIMLNNSLGKLRSGQRCYLPL